METEILNIMTGISKRYPQSLKNWIRLCLFILGQPQLMLFSKVTLKGQVARLWNETDYTKQRF